MLKSLAAATYNLDDQGTITTTKLEKSLVYDKTIDPAHSDKTFTMPNIKAGSIIE